jgi:hypothetical protein
LRPCEVQRQGHTALRRQPLRIGFGVAGAPGTNTPPTDRGVLGKPTSWAPASSNRRRPGGRRECWVRPRTQLRPAIGSRAPAPPRPKPTSVYNSVFMAAFTCCGGEWLILLPGIGCVHLPSTVDGFSHSLALPILIAAYLSTVLATHLSVALTLGRKWSSLSLSICISAVFMPLALRPPSPLIEVAIKVSRLHK